MFLIHEPQLLRTEGSLSRRRGAWWVIAPAGIHQRCLASDSSRLPIGSGPRPHLFYIIDDKLSSLRSWMRNLIDAAGA